MGRGFETIGQGRNFWQRPKLSRLYSDPLQALKGEHLSALGSQERVPEFLRPQYLTAAVSQEMSLLTPLPPPPPPSPPPPPKKSMLVLLLLCVSSV